MLQTTVAGAEESRTWDVGTPGSAWSLLLATLRLYARYPLLFIVLAAVVVVPYDLAVLAITGAGPLELGRLGFFVSQLLGLASVALVNPLIAALHVHAVREAREGRRPRLLPVARQGLRVLPIVTAVAVISWLGIVVGFVALIVPGVVLLFRWSVAAQVAAIDRGDWKGALQSSRLLTIDRWGQIFLLFLYLGIVIVVPLLALNHVFPRDSTTGASVACGLAYSVLSRSLFALGAALLFFDLRDRRPAATSVNAPALTAKLAETKRADKAAAKRPPAAPTGELAAPAANRVRPRGNPIDPRSYSDAERPRGWWIDPEKPEEMRCWGTADRQGWSGARPTPRKLKRVWEDQAGGEPAG
jgi:hypothetical protein